MYRFLPERQQGGSFVRKLWDPEKPLRNLNEQTVGMTRDCSYFASLGSVGHGILQNRALDGMMMNVHAWSASL